MQLNKIGDRWQTDGEYDERHIPKDAGFRWDGALKIWYTKNISQACDLAKYTEGATRAELLAHLKGVQETFELSQAVYAEIEIPCNPGMEPLGYQKAGVDFSIKTPGCLLGDEMGLGKTIQAALLINALRSEIQRVIIICPAFLKLNWQRELLKWIVGECTIELINAPQAKSANFSEAGIYITNYEIVGRCEDELKAEPWDLIICDESHRLKNGKAKRTKIVCGYWDKETHKWIDGIPAKRKLFLTGTPMVNRPSELWTSLKYLDPKSWSSKNKFLHRYCDFHHDGYGWNDKGSSNLEELQEKLRTTVMVRRLKKDVLTELPPKVRQVIELPVNGATSTIKREQEAWQQHANLVVELRAVVELAKASDDPEDYEQAVKELKEGVGAAFSEMSQLRHDTALAKVDSVVAHATDAVESSGKLVIFGWHKDVLNFVRAGIEEALPEGDYTALITGDVAMDSRQAQVDKFQDDPRCRVILGTMGAMGVGITLTASSHVLCSELDYVPGVVTQAEDRCHRIGQHDSVLVQHLVLEGSLDATMVRMLVAKQAVLDAALDDAIELDLVVPEEPKERAATATLSPKKIEKAAAWIDPALLEQIHTGLRMLSGMCDGAVSEDNAGFNKVDSRIGKSLASSPKLSTKQAVLGRAILYKYHRQLPTEINDAIREAAAA